MAASYSIDLRIRVLAEYDKGILQKQEIAKLFKIEPAISSKTLTID